MDKAIGAYRTISEVGEELDIPQHVLRFWETRFPQIKPMKRSGGRRYYRPGDVLLLKGIRRLLYGEGYTIKGVQRILATQGAGVVQRAGGASGEELAGIADAPPSGEFGGGDHGRQTSGVEPFEDVSVASSEAQPKTEPEPRTDHRAPLTRDLFSGQEVLVSSTPRRVRSTLSSEHRRLLQAALDDLGECSRLLDSLGEAGTGQQVSTDDA
ncbi:MAG: MerR family transcriptional regulator [Hyphomicrobiales bacterium]|nr:MerR family transcriptional regulator [Hyphomicrobiales bacterium]